MIWAALPNVHLPDFCIDWLKYVLLSEPLNLPHQRLCRQWVLFHTNDARVFHVFQVLNITWLFI